MRKLIVNADDFGLTEGVNRAVIEGHRNGIITSTTLMANGPAFDSAVAGSLQAPNLGVGVHLNLTQGRPVRPASQVPSIVTSEGTFYPSPGILAWRITTRRVRPRDVEAEFRSQIEKISSAGIRITHLDSHKHIHLLPALFGVVVKLASEYGIDCVRYPVEPAPSTPVFLPSGQKHFAGRVKQYLLARALSTLAACQVKTLDEAGFCRTDRFYGLSQTGFLDASLLEQILRTVPDGTSELMCHPGYIDQALLETHTRLRVQREAEIEALSSESVRRLVTKLGIKLISYGELPPPKGCAARKRVEPVQEALRKG